MADIKNEFALMQELLNKRQNELLRLAQSTPFQITTNEDGQLSVYIEVTVQPMSHTVVRDGILVDVPDPKRGWYGTAVVVDKETNQYYQLTPMVEGATPEKAIAALDAEIVKHAQECV